MCKEGPHPCLSNHGAQSESASTSTSSTNKGPGGDQSEWPGKSLPRTVNEGRSRAGEAEESSRASTDDISSSLRGALRSHRGADERTKDQLYAEAKRRGINGRSQMTKRQLAEAVGR